MQTPVKIPEGRGFKSRPVHHTSYIIQGQDPLLKPLRARIIALEGIDQSGKQTQARLLAKRLTQLDYQVAIVSFPIYQSFTGRRIRDYLNREKNYPIEALHMLYSLNRWENLKLIKKLIRDNNFLIADRYTPSNLAYGVSRGLNLEWLEELDKGLPQPDLVIVLDTSVPSSFQRKSKGRDAHESNRQFLEKVRSNYQTLAKSQGWKIVHASGSLKQVESEVWKILRERFHLPETDPHHPRST